MTRTLLVVEDHALVSEGILKVVTTRWPDLVAHQANDLASALRCLDTAAAPGIEVIITDLNLPDAQGLDTLIRLRAQAPRARIGVVSGSNELALALACLREGACAFVPKAGSLAHFTEGLRTLAHGGVYFPRELLAQAHAAVLTGTDDAQATGATTSAALAGRAVSPARLTPRQVEVRALLLHGLANALIADQLGISEETVKLHVRAILRAHGAHNRVQLLLNCARDGLPEATSMAR